MTVPAVSWVPFELMSKKTVPLICALAVAESNKKTGNIANLIALLKVFRRPYPAPEQFGRDKFPFLP